MSLKSERMIRWWHVSVNHFFHIIYWLCIWWTTWCV